MSMKNYNISDLTNITSTPFGYTLSIIGGKWKIIIYSLSKKGLSLIPILEEML
ncbi:hypothetical protein [Clostridioides sp. ZZV14-6150]|uniref:hypothetical protein n=1 Tax=unclassified Clostridioides TaxID=2635829 RepID=UPI001D12A4BD|nr:hypothetical protein [Clostridioides sp. ZZV14-6150]MCC0738833.1 hypothetical protein [Clostridioides sp. ZZV14-5902]